MTASNSLIWNGKQLSKEMRTEIEDLPTLTVNALRDKFAEVLGYGTNSRNREFLIRKITWGIQAREWGDISEEARKRAYEIADFRHLRRCLLKPEAVPSEAEGQTQRRPCKLSRDPRLPMTGCLLSKEHEGKQIHVQVLENGFSYEGKVYRSLSAIARFITGTNWNGFAFFQLGGGK